MDVYRLWLTEIQDWQISTSNMCSPFLHDVEWQYRPTYKRLADCCLYSDHSQACRATPVWQLTLVDSGVKVNKAYSCDLVA